MEASSVWLVEELAVIPCLCRHRLVWWAPGELAATLSAHTRMCMRA